MRDNPQRNLQWLEQELLAAERPASQTDITQDTADLLDEVDMLLEELRDPEPPVFVQKGRRQSLGQQAERAHISKQFDPNAAVVTKSRKQLRREAKQQRIAEKKSHVNRKIGDLVFLAVLECIGIACILGWWMQ